MSLLRSCRRFRIDIYKDLAPTEHDRPFRPIRRIAVSPFRRFAKSPFRRILDANARPFISSFVICYWAGLVSPYRISYG
jgi:hypothetical protein